MKLNEIKNTIDPKAILVRALELNYLWNVYSFLYADLMLIISASPGQERHLAAKLQS